MTDASSTGLRWAAWLWVVWVSTTLLAAVAVAYISWVIVAFGAACDSGRPVPSSVRELQTILVLGGLLCAVSCFVVARFSGRWWWRAGVSAAVIASTPLLIVLTHLTLASWSGSGLCDM
ncbi:hypothetical protein acdb102_42480 [Acidothermaceae bacterium B102]|nr:hypothetical protein acdb102_33510 [Acidothermaceae bacterium B102]BEP15937.1 hypothetical protein acdb102_42480 [Acidothermaceae bacterium B102]